MDLRIKLKKKGKRRSIFDAIKLYEENKEAAVKIVK